MVTAMVERALRPLVDKPKGWRGLVVFWVALNALLSGWLLHKTRQVPVNAAVSTVALPNMQIHGGSAAGASLSSQALVAHSGTAGLIGIEDASHYTASSPPAQGKDTATMTATTVANHTAFAGSLGPKVAVVIETKLTPNLIPVMMHFAAVLGPTWQMVLFTMEAGWAAPASAAFGRLAAAGLVAVRFLPADTDFSTHASVSAWLVRPWLWEQLLPARRALLFQTDSIVCANAALRADDFLEWDLIGAPIDAAHGHGYNGGLSLRNPAMMLRVARNASVDFATDAASGENRLKFEDQWFYARLSELPDARLPGRDVAMTFAVETIYYDRPLGYHQPGRWQKDRMKEIEEWCPEVKMLIGPRY